MARQKNLARRHEILRNTFMLLKKRGMENVSLQMIADKSGISKSLLQSYYPHKNLLITEIVTNFMTAVLKSLNATDFKNLNTYSKMKIFIYLILEQGIQDEGVERVVKSILSDGDSLDRWSQILDDWLKHEGVKHDLGNDRQVQIGLNFIVTAGGGLYVKRTEFDLDADQISDINVRQLILRKVEEMAVRTRSELRRIDQAQTVHDKRSFGIAIFTIVVLFFSLVTFMNPIFMRSQIAKESNGVVAERYINQKFDNFAAAIGADRSSNNSTNNLLTVEQTRPIANAMIDYTLGIHLFRAENSSLASQIRKVILTKIDDNSSMEAKSVQEKLKKNKESGLYAIITSFGLANATLAANVELVFLILNILVIIFVGILAYQQIKRLKEIVSTGRLINMFAAGGMRASLGLIVIFGLLAFIPTIFNVEGLILNIGYFLEIASGIFLELVIVGVVLFVISTVTWQLTSAK